MILRKGSSNLATARKGAGIMTARYFTATKVRETWSGIMKIGFTTTPCSISILITSEICRFYGNPHHH